jgi:hypothetical protein
VEKQMKKLKVNMDMLMWAFEDASGCPEYFLNTETGELLPEDELPGWGEGEKAPDNPSLVSVSGVDPAEGFRDMEDFVAIVEDPACRLTLTRALGGRGSFSRFRDALSAYPEEREHWFKFKEERVRVRILEWLSDNGIEPIEDEKARDRAPKQ